MHLEVMRMGVNGLFGASTRPPPLEERLRLRRVTAEGGRFLPCAGVAMDGEY